MAPNPVADGIGRGFNDITDQKYEEDITPNCTTTIY
jgi:hypothetical protein